MRVIKNINNNVSLCCDSKGREVIVFGKGIGFIKPPYEIPLKQIDRSFYNIKDINFSGLKDLSAPVMHAAIRIVDEVEENLNITLLSTAALSLADHINFALQRLEKHIKLGLPIQEDLKQAYSKEMKQAQLALKIIEEETGVMLEQDEAGMIALHFINNRLQSQKDSDADSTQIIKDCMAIIEEESHITIDIDSFNYSRFVTHLDYLLKRILKNDQIVSANNSMFTSLKGEYPATYRCASKISDLLQMRLDITLSDEEILYLMLHINRLCTRAKDV